MMLAQSHRTVMLGEDKNDVTASLDVTISSDPRIDVSAVDVVGAIPEYIISRAVPRYIGYCGMISKIYVGDPALLWLLRQLRKLRQPMEQCRSDCGIVLPKTPRACVPRCIHIFAASTTVRSTSV